MIEWEEMGETRESPACQSHYQWYSAHVRVGVGGEIACCAMVLFYEAVVRDMMNELVVEILRNANRIQEMTFTKSWTLKGRRINMRS